MFSDRKRGLADEMWWGERPREPGWVSHKLFAARGDARPTSQKTAQGLLGVLAADADDERDDAGMPRRDFVKRRGFFFQGEANEGGWLGERKYIFSKEYNGKNLLIC